MPLFRARAWLQMILMTILGVIGAFRAIRQQMYGWMMAGLAAVAQIRRMQPNLLAARYHHWGRGGGTLGRRAEVVMRAAVQEVIVGHKCRFACVLRFDTR